MSEGVSEGVCEGVSAVLTDCDCVPLVSGSW